MFDDPANVHGHRIELDEIETTLAAHASVLRAVVLVRSDGPGEESLVAYVVPSEGKRPTSAQLRAYLERRLPEHMVPAIILTLSKRRRTRSRKRARVSPARDRR